MEGAKAQDVLGCWGGWAENYNGKEQKLTRKKGRNEQGSPALSTGQGFRDPAQEKNKKITVLSKNGPCFNSYFKRHQR